MLHLFHQFNFTLDRFPTIWLLQLILFVNFESNFLVSWLVQADAYTGIRTLTNLLSDDILIERSLLRETHGVIHTR